MNAPALPPEASEALAYLAQRYSVSPKHLHVPAPDAATQGIEIYAEHSEDARLNPGKHPNIDRLIGLVERGETLRVKHVFAT